MLSNDVIIWLYYSHDVGNDSGLIPENNPKRLMLIGLMIQKLIWEERKVSWGTADDVNVKKLHFPHLKNGNSVQLRVLRWGVFFEMEEPGNQPCEKGGKMQGTAPRLLSPFFLVPLLLLYLFLAINTCFCIIFSLIWKSNGKTDGIGQDWGVKMNFVVLFISLGSMI